MFSILAVSSSLWFSK